MIVSRSAGSANLTTSPMRFDFLSALPDRTLLASDSWLMGVDSSKRRERIARDAALRCRGHRGRGNREFMDHGRWLALHPERGAGGRHPVGLEPDLTSENSAGARPH